MADCGFRVPPVPHLAQTGRGGKESCESWHSDSRTADLIGQAESLSVGQSPRQPIGEQRKFVRSPPGVQSLKVRHAVRLLRAVVVAVVVAVVSFVAAVWRRGRDSNPRDPYGPTRSPGEHLRPLGHLSVSLRERAGPTSSLELGRCCCSCRFFRFFCCRLMAVRVGFEPTRPLRVYALSRRARSANSATSPRHDGYES